MLSFKSTFSLSSFTFIKRPFSSSSLSAIRVVSSAYLYAGSLQHWSLLSALDTPKTECNFCLGPAASFFLELLIIALAFPHYHIGHLLTWGAHPLVSYLFAFSYCSWRSQGKNTGVGCLLHLWWITVCQNSSLWPVLLRWLCTAWLIASLSYASPFVMKSLWPMKG